MVLQDGDVRRIRMWLARALAPSGVGLYGHKDVADARATLWRLGLFTRYSGHLTNRYKAGARVRRGVEHAVELLKRA